GERTVGGYIPDFEARPFAAGELWFQRQRPLAELYRVCQINSLAVNLLAIAGNNFGEPQRESPFEVHAQLGTFAGFQHKCFTVAFAADVEVPDQNLACRHKKVSATQRIKDWLPAFFEARQAVQTNGNDVNVPVEFVRVIDLEDIDFARHAFALPPIRHVIEQIERALAETFARKIGGHRFPRRAQPEVREIKSFMPENVPRPPRRFYARMG